MRTRDEALTTSFCDDRPLAVLWRRFRWRLHWALRAQHPFVVDPWWRGMTLVLPRSGSAAAAYYRTFPSEAIAQYMSQVLRPGMTVIDVGAHVGVWSLLAGYLVGPAGVVHAIEPQSECVAIIEQNATLNGLSHLETYELALSDADRFVGLDIDCRRMSASATSIQGGDRSVSAITLESFAQRVDVGWVDLLKLDAAGGEFGVFCGAKSLLESGAIANIICKLYHPDVVAERFGEDDAPYATVALLREVGYEVTVSGTPCNRELLEHLFATGAYTLPAVATRRI